MPDINFFQEETRFKLPHPRITSRWIRSVAESEKSKLTFINFIFCSDRYLKRINLEYLAHDTFTDIITFDYSDSKGIQGDVFISIPRVKENAQQFETPFDEELHRVMVHGVLHLIGYSDKTERAKSIMRKKEDAYLSLRR
ncbi:MAG TPA: rRNA maturation RNase YbeY [Chryseolinea sp.]